MTEDEKIALVNAWRTNTALGRLAENELVTAINWLLERGYQITAPAVEVGGSN